jgi:type IV pilus assembly protein PilW
MNRREDAMKLHQLSYENNTGFSLPDLLVGLMLIGLLAAAVFGVYQVSQGSYLAGAMKAEMQENARVALDRMATEIREAGFNPAGVGPGASGPAITGAAPGDLTFSFDCNSNGTLDAGETLQYRVAGSSLARQCSTGTNEPLIDGIQALTFSYFDVNGNPLPIPPATTVNPADVRAVSIAITVRPAATVSSPTGPQQSTFVTQIRLRNAI